MKILLAILRYTWATAWYTFAVLVVLLAVLFSTARLLLPHAEAYRAELEERLSAFIGQPARIDSLDAEWRGLGPSLVLKDVSLLDEGAKQRVLAFRKIRVGVDLPASLLQREVMFTGITLVGLDLGLTRSPDGRIALRGMGLERGGDRQDLRAVTQWLFSQPELRIEDSSLTWIEQRLAENARLRLSDVNILLRNDENRHWLDISLSLPGGAGESLSLSVDMLGDPLASAQGRRTRLYLKARGMPFTRLLPALSPGGVSTSIASADFELWMDWLDGIPRRVEGTVDLGGITLAAGEGRRRVSRRFERLAGRFRWARENGGWHFEGDRLALARSGEAWEPSRVSLGYRTGGAGQEARLDFGASFLRLDGLRDLADLALALEPTAARELLEDLQHIDPRGEIRDLRGYWEGDDEPRYRVYARFENLAGDNWQRFPAVAGASGRVWLAEGGGLLHLQDAEAALLMPEMFREPLLFDAVSGDLAWRTDATGWSLSGRRVVLANDDIQASVTLDMQGKANGGSPFISLLGSFRDADGRRVSAYLPTGILKPATVAWLDEAIREGHVPRGGVVLHGRLGDFPFRHGEGAFEVRFDVRDGQLDYARDWPPIHDIRAEVVFRGRAMDIRADHGRIFDNRILWTRVGIADLGAMPLLVEVKGEVSGSTQQKLDYLAQSPPLARKFGSVVELLQARGDSVLALDLALPVQETENTRVSGTVTLTDNALAVRPVGGVLDQVSGELHFSDEGLGARDLPVKLLGQPATLDIDRGPQGQTRVLARGRFDGADLARRYLPQVADLLSGGSAWEVRLDVPMAPPEERRKPAVLRVESSLQGLASRLPPPLDKPAGRDLSLWIGMEFPDGQAPHLSLALGGFLSGIFEFGEGGPLGLRRGELRFNDGNATLPEQAGLRLSGHLQRFSLDDWRSILGGDGGETAAWLLSTDIALDEGELYGQTLHDLRLRVTPGERQWRARVESRELSGLLIVPRGDLTRPFEAELDYCRLDELSDPGGEPPDPRRLPPLKIRIGDLSYDDLRLGGLELETLPVHNGLKIKHLLLTPPDTRISASGGWFMRGGRPLSRFDIHMESENVEETLRALGYAGNIGGGTGRMDLSLSWPGTPVAVFGDKSLARGKVSMDLRKGQLLEVDPGAGRLFGLLSVQTLPRRLLLDFADVFREGFRFDRLSGDFTIEDGDAYTSNLFMVGPAARIDVTGRIGLVAEDYDQRVTVIPRISETLPLIGALALSPQIGAAILFAQKVLEPQINKVTQVEYSITGSWEDPQIRRLRDESTPSGSADSFLDE